MFATTAKPTLQDKKEQTAEDLNDGVRRIKEDVRAAADVVREDLEDVARTAGHRVHEFANSATQSAASAGDVLKEKIRDNPIQSSAIALGVGVIVGLLFRR